MPLSDVITNGHPPPAELWRHPDPQGTHMWAFMQNYINEEYGLHLQTYDELYQWSINNIGEFWDQTRSYCGIHAQYINYEVGQFLSMVT